MKAIKLFCIISILIMQVPALKAINPDDSTKFYNWQNTGPAKKKSWGVGTDKAYTDLLKGRKSKTVIVAVIDNGVDTNHIDLKGHFWVNKGEIPGNGIDDDHNGYIDDIHGWNFLGNAKGENIDHAPLEVTRLYRKYLDKYGVISADSVKKYNPSDLEKFKQVTSYYKEKTKELMLEEMGFQNFLTRYKHYDSLLTLKFGKKEYSKKELKKLKPEKKSSLDSAKKFMVMYKKMGITPSIIKEGKDYIDSKEKYHYNVDFNPRNIIGDNPDVWSDTAYGNNMVNADGPDHGTMVSGVIAADRYNNLGIKGIADNVKIMVIRTVPDGDEWDKDVAKAIEYAINNGAEIINMSFGKPFSPNKEFVDKIVSMADANNVLLVHAAGNDGEDIDTMPDFPNQYSKADNKLLAENWITVGASTKFKKKKKFVAGFSNYGQKSVDLFAPGQDIITCAPGNKYKKVSGTSFSAPMVTGAAALIKSYFPNLTAKEIKDILLESSSFKDMKVKRPEPDNYNSKKHIYVKFSTLSTTGGVLNVYKAIQLARQISDSKG